MIQEIVIVRAVLLVTVDEAFNEPENKKYRESITQDAAVKEQQNAEVQRSEHLRMRSAACRRVRALLRAFIPRHADWITMTTQANHTE